MTPLKQPSVTLPRLLSYLLVGIAFIGFVAYVVFQARFLLLGPQITLREEPLVIQNNQQVILRGDAKNITEITLNGRQIVTSQAGYFEEPLILENGYTIASIKAQDRYGRSVVLEQEFVYTPLSRIQ